MPSPDGDVSIAAPQPPRLPRHFDADALVDLDPDFPDLDGLQTSGSEGTLAFPDARTFTVLRSRLTGVAIEIPDDTGLDLQDVELTDIDLTGRRVEGGVLRSGFARCRLGGLDLGDATVRDVRFEDCVLDLASARKATLERVVFSGCRLDGLDLTGATLTDVVFDDCALGAVTLDRARLTRVDVRGAELAGVDLATLRGAVISTDQAIVLAARLAHAAGLVVDDPARE